MLLYQFYLSTLGNCFKFVMMTPPFSSDSSYGSFHLLWSKMIDLTTLCYFLKRNLSLTLWFPGLFFPNPHYNTDTQWPVSTELQTCWVFFSTALGEDIKKAYPSLGKKVKEELLVP